MGYTNQETGHYKNVANFKGLIQFCQSLGTAYQPARPDMTIASLRNIYDAAATVMSEVLAAELELSKATQTRILAFHDAKKMATKICNTLVISNPASTALKTSKHYLAKIRGTRLGPIASEPAAPEAAEQAKTRSVRQTSFDALIVHFEKLVNIAVNENNYRPNESEITIDALKAQLAYLNEVNSAAVHARSNQKLLIARRNQMLYAPIHGVADIAATIKKYIAVVFGHNSNQLKAANVFTVLKAK